jgi:PilZ domain
MQTAIKERRLSPRENLSEPVRVRPCDPRYLEEVCPTLNVSRSGLYFVTSTGHYFPGMNVFVTLNYGPGDATQREQTGDVVRSQKLASGNWGVAIRILMQNNPGVYSGT